MTDQFGACQLFRQSGHSFRFGLLVFRRTPPVALYWMAVSGQGVDLLLHAGFLARGSVFKNDALLDRLVDERAE